MRDINGSTVSMLMSMPIRAVRPDTTLRELKEVMTRHDYHGFPVVDAEGILQGLVTRTDLFKIALDAALPPTVAGPPATVAQIMSRDVIVLRPEERVSMAMLLMVYRRVVTIPIVTATPEGRKVIGVITRRDVARALSPDTPESAPSP